MPVDSAEAWFAEWRRLSERFGSASPGAGAPSGLSGLQDAGAAFARFAEEYGRLLRPAGAAAPAEGLAAVAAQARAFAEQLVASVLPAWVPPPAAGATPELLAAFEAWSGVVRGIASEAAARFGARLAASDAPDTLRGAFDAWIDCAEGAFQRAAHAEAFVTAAARLLNEAVAQRARQQALLDRGARALGMPTRAEVDGLHDALRALKAERVVARRPKAPARARRAPSRKRRPAGKPK